ncbi:MAG: SPOR domain-containing protein [Bacteroidetes bacterium]|nr:SPOR domain-containing protein [Bacteroidota bacterium]
MACWSFSNAQSGTIIIHKDTKINRLLDFYAAHENSIEEMQGYRIQIMAGTSRDKAYKTQGNFNYAYPQFRSYLQYNSPYFKIRVGDFTDRLNAHRFLQQVKQKYPGSFMVDEVVKLR